MSETLEEGRLNESDRELERGGEREAERCEEKERGRK